MKAVILCGGLGTRIRDVPEDLPKPMIRIGPQPILWHIMKLYSASDINSFVLCLGYRSWAVKDYFLNYTALTSDVALNMSTGDVEFRGDAAKSLGWQVSMIETGLNTQTGGRLWQIRDQVAGSELFCVTYGDGVADIDIAAIVEFHKAHGKVGTVTGVRPPGRFGVMESVFERGVEVITEFKEKPQTGDGLINGGFFVFDHRLFDYLTDDDGLIFEQQPLSELAADGELVLFEHAGFWQPMDTYREWRLLNDLWDAGDAPWRR